MDRERATALLTSKTAKAIWLALRAAFAHFKRKR